MDRPNRELKQRTTKIFRDQIKSKKKAITIGAPLHELLEVDVNASFDELHKAYQRVSKQFYPDQLGETDDKTSGLYLDLEFINTSLTSRVQEATETKLEERAEIKEKNVTLNNLTGPLFHGNTPQYGVGQTLDHRFHLDALLGQGGMGMVFRATDLMLDRIVAVKVLQHELVGDENSFQRFLREARAAARIEHPNTVKIYDFGILPAGGTYIVMEFIHGDSLRDLINKNLTVDIAEAINIMKQTCGAIMAAHQVGVIHRDLKPENIMLKIMGDHNMVKVVDLGLAKFIETISYSLGNLTAQNEILGTPCYMSPEQCITSKIDPATDIYALGIIFYEMLVGEPPFQGSIAAVMRKHHYEPVPDMRAINPEIPLPLAELITQMLAKRKEDRPPLREVISLLNYISVMGIFTSSLSNPVRATSNLSQERAETLRLTLEEEMC